MNLILITLIPILIVCGCAAFRIIPKIPMSIMPALLLGIIIAGSVFGHDFFTQLLVELLAPPAVTQSDRDSALGVMLTDDMTVKFGNDLAWTELRHT